MKNTCTNRLAQPAQSDSPQRYTFCAEHNANPMACLVDLFHGGFEIEPWDADLARVKVHPDFTPTTELISAMSVLDGDVPPGIFCAWANHGAICVCWHWIDAIEADYDWQLPESAWAIAYGTTEVAA